MEISLWRRYLRAAFEPHIGLAGVRSTIKIWDQGFTLDADILTQIRPFTQTVSAQLNRTDLRATLALALFTVLSDKKLMLPIDPLAPATPAEFTTFIATLPAATVASNALKLDSSGNALREQGTPISLDLSEVNSEDLTLSCLLTIMHSMLGQNILSGSALWIPSYDRCLKQCPSDKSLALTGRQTLAWQQWLEQSFKSPLIAKLSIKQCRAIVSKVYVFLANALGPVEADMFLNQAIKQAESSVPNGAVSPRQFL